MKKFSAKRALIYVVVIGVGAAVGIFGGDFYVKYRGAAEAAAKAVETQAYLDKHIKDIAVGSKFPEIPVRVAADGRPIEISEGIPNGGVILFLSGDCPSCLVTIDVLSGALARKGTDATPILIIADQDGTPLLERLKSKGHDLLVLSDYDRVLAQIHGVVVYPTYFIVNAQHVVTEIGTDASTEAKFVDLLSS